MKYQFVMQFPEELYGDIDWIVEMEDKLANHFVEAEIDGHDIGSGEVNIFIDTNVPMETFEIIRKVLKDDPVFNDVKIAYRDFNCNQYICLWPRDLINFDIK